MKKRSKKQVNKARMFGLAALVIFAAALGLSLFGISSTVGNIKSEISVTAPEAILASAGVQEGEDIFLTVSYFDQRQDECANVYDLKNDEAVKARQFEWTDCGFGSKKVERGLVGFELNDKYLPVAQGGKLTPNRGLTDMTRWFETVEGKSQNYIGNLKLDYKEQGSEFSFHQNQFYPLDEVGFSDGDAVNRDGHNHLFTMNFAVPFTALYSGDEKFEITADDDTFVFVDDKLVIDLGGVHAAKSARFAVRENGDIYTGVGKQDLAYAGVTLDKEKQGSMVRIFHADRDASESVFKLKFANMNLGVTSEKLANREGDGMQIAYDPTNPSYVAPLGETSIMKPDNTKGFILIVTIEAIMVMVFAMLMAASIRDLLRRKQKR